MPPTKKFTRRRRKGGSGLGDVAQEGANQIAEHVRDFAQDPTPWNFAKNAAQVLSRATPLGLIKAREEEARQLTEWGKVHHNRQHIEQKRLDRRAQEYFEGNETLRKRQVAERMDKKRQLHEARSLPFKERQAALAKFRGSARRPVKAKGTRR
jgi:hypothetical protein